MKLFIHISLIIAAAVFIWSFNRITSLYLETRLYELTFRLISVFNIINIWSRETMMALFIPASAFWFIQPDDFSNWQQQERKKGGRKNQLGMKDEMMDSSFFFFHIIEPKGSCLTHGGRITGGFLFFFFFFFLLYFFWHFVNIRRRVDWFEK